MNAVDLFAGAGGASRGLHDAGYEVVGYDHWPPAVECHNANGLPAHLHDLSDPAQDHLIPYAPLWWASPPCQPFSAAGAGDGEFDGRDGFPWLLRLVTLRLPDVLIVENVKGLTFRKHSAYLCGILEALRALGYHVEWKVLLAADYGVPQTRERCIIIARRDGGPITWPTPTHCETGGMFTARWVSMADALDWGDRDSVTLHYRQTDREGEPITCDVTDRPSPCIGTQSQGQWLLEVVLVGNNSVAGGPLAERRLDEPAMTLGVRGDLWKWTTHRPATSINGDHRVSAPGRHDPTISGSQQADAIRLTTHELATLQGFPADWTWTGTKTQQARMIGNAVPPRLAEVVATANRPAVHGRRINEVE